MHRMTTTSRALRAALVAIGATVLLTGGVVPEAVPQATAVAPYCGITWGSLPRTDPRLVAGPIINARAGQHPCYDRLVIDLRTAPAPGYSVRYVSRVLTQGSGHVVPLCGGAFLQVVVRAPAYDLAGHATYRPSRPLEAVSVTGFRTFRQVAFAGSFEGYTSFGLGVRARLPFRVFMLNGPGSHTRLVIDVAHRWS